MLLNSTSSFSLLQSSSCTGLTGPGLNIQMRDKPLICTGPGGMEWRTTGELACGFVLPAGPSVKGAILEMRVGLEGGAHSRLAVEQM